MREIGVRELRSTLPTVVRRAAGGEATAITVNGRIEAVLGPAGAPSAVDLTTLIASGAVIAPRRPDAALPTETVRVWGNVRLDRLLREIRG